MKPDFTKTCPQTQRALRMLVTPHAPKIDRLKLIDALPGPTPADPKELLDLIIQIILALLENKDGDKPEKPDGPDDEFAGLKRIAKQAAIDTIDADTLKRDIPKLVASIRSVAAMIPVLGFPTPRAAREAMRVANNQALGASAPNWHTWNTAIRTALDALDEDHHLTDLSDYKHAWTVIADALESIN